MGMGIEDGARVRVRVRVRVKWKRVLYFMHGAANTVKQT